MENTVDKIQDAIKTYVGSNLNIPSFAINFDFLTIEARSSWASMLFSNTSDQAIIRYASYQLKALNRCLLSLGDALEVDEQRFKMASYQPSDIPTKLLLLLDAFFDDFGDYINANMICPQFYHRYVCASSTSERNLVATWIDTVSINKIIGDMIKSYLVRMNDFANYRFQYAEIAYYQKFVRELKSWLHLNIEGDLTQVLTEKLIELNFNHLDLFNFRQQQIRAKFERLNPRPAISIIRQELLKIPFQEKRNTLRLDYRWLPTGEMLCNWLTGELNSFETQLNADSKNSQNLQKLPFQLSVAHLACLIRLFAKEHIFGEIPLTEIFNFFGRNCSSKRQSVISAGGISKEFYSMSQVVAAEMRDILQRMINRINRDYFPVVVVMLLIIGAC